MIDLTVNLLLFLNKIFGNLGLTIIFIGVASRLLFHPFLRSSLRQTQIMRDLKPKLDELKKKHGHDRSRHLQEQQKLYKEAGINPTAGCLAPLVQIGVAFLLFISLRSLLDRGIATNFLVWDLAKTNTWQLSGVPFALPGILVVATAFAQLIQGKMSLPEKLPIHKDDSKKEKVEKADFAETMAASQGQLVLLMPLFVLLWGGQLPSGIFLYWFVSTAFGIVQQYYIAGLGSLKEWLGWLKRN